MTIQTTITWFISPLSFDTHYVLDGCLGGADRLEVLATGIMWVERSDDREVVSDMDDTSRELCAL